MKLKAVISGRIQNHPDTWLALSWNDIMETWLDSQAIRVPPGLWIYMHRYGVRQRCVINSNGMQICGGWDKYLRSIKYFPSLEKYFHFKMAIFWSNQKGISILTILAHKLTIWLHVLIPSQEGLYYCSLLLLILSNRPVIRSNENTSRESHPYLIR